MNIYLISMLPSNLAEISDQNGHKNEACNQYNESIETLRRLIAEEPKITEYQHLLSSTLCDLAITQTELQQTKHAERAYTEALLISEQLAEKNPTITSYTFDFGRTIRLMASLQMSQSATISADQLYKRCIPILVKCVEIQPDNKFYRKELTRAYFGHSLLCRRLHRFGDAIAAKRQIAKLWPETPSTLYDLACEIAYSIPASTKADAEGLALEANSTLRAAIGLGWNDASLTAHAPDLAPIHHRKDFQAILQGLQDRAFPADPFAK